MTPLRTLAVVDGLPFEQSHSLNHPAQTLLDHNGRPHYLIENRELIRELL